MAPRESPMKAIRRKSVAQSRPKSSALSGSGFRNLQSRNAIVSGTRPIVETSEVDRLVNATTQRKTKNKVTKVAKPRTTQSAPKSAMRVEPATEHWAPVGGVPNLEDEDEMVEAQPSATLGIARIAGWRLDTFTASLKALMTQHVEHKELSVISRDVGGEIVVDIYVQFSSELIARAGKESMDGEMLDGRKLRLNYT